MRRYRRISFCNVILEHRRITDAIPHTIIVLGPDGALFYANQAVSPLIVIVLRSKQKPGS